MIKNSHYISLNTISLWTWTGLELSLAIMSRSFWVSFVRKLRLELLLCIYYHFVLVRSSTRVQHLNNLAPDPLVLHYPWVEGHGDRRVRVWREERVLAIYQCVSIYVVNHPRIKCFTFRPISLIYGAEDVDNLGDLIILKSRQQKVLTVVLSKLK